MVNLLIYLAVTATWYQFFQLYYNNSTLLGSALFYSPKLFLFGMLFARYVYNRIHSLNNKARYSLLKTPFVPSSSYHFPATADEYDKKRWFQYSWLHSFPGSVYFQCTNGKLCKYCVLFWWLECEQLRILVSQPLINFAKASEILYYHSYGKQGKGKLFHINVVSDFLDFIKFMKFSQ